MSIITTPPQPLNPDRRRWPTIGDILNALVDSIEGHGLRVAGGSLDATGLTVDMGRGRAVRIRLEADRPFDDDEIDGGDYYDPQWDDDRWTTGIEGPELVPPELDDDEDLNDDQGYPWGGD